MQAAIGVNDLADGSCARDVAIVATLNGYSRFVIQRVGPCIQRVGPCIQRGNC